MVKISLIRQSNNQIDEASAPRVAVFVGGTSGIGKITLGEIARLGTGFKAYVIGRKESEQSFKSFIEELHQANPNANVVWVEGEVSLLAEVKRVCDYIRTLESSVDLLFMTTGYAPFGGRESLDVSHALGYYSRICFIESLLPLLRASGNARVISVLSGGLESKRLFNININDLNLEQPGAFGAVATQMLMGIMGTLTLERLAEIQENQSIIFIHSHPGIVRTGNLFRGWKEGSWGSWMAAIFMDPILMLVAYNFKESAERHLYQVTGGAFGGKGPTLPGIVGRTTRGETTSGLFLVNYKCDAVVNEKGLAKLRRTAGDAVLAKTQEIIRPYV